MYSEAGEFTRPALLSGGANVAVSRHRKKGRRDRLRGPLVQPNRWKSGPISTKHEHGRFQRVNARAGTRTAQCCPPTHSMAGIWRTGRCRWCRCRRQPEYRCRQCPRSWGGAWGPLRGGICLALARSRVCQRAQTAGSRWLRQRSGMRCASEARCCPLTVVIVAAVDCYLVAPGDVVHLGAKRANASLGSRGRAELGECAMRVGIFCAHTGVTTHSTRDTTMRAARTYTPRYRRGSALCAATRVRGRLQTSRRAR